MLNIKMSTKWGPVFTFSLPEEAACPFAPLSVTSLVFTVAQITT